MAYKITDACVSCGACASECPVNAISQGDSIFVIDADTCIDCGNCAKCLSSRSSSTRVIKHIKNYLTFCEMVLFILHKYNHSH